MNKVMLTAVAVVLPLFAATPAFAVKGIDAARSCEAQKARCVALYDDAGGVTLILDGGASIIDCPSPQEQCAMASLQTPKPGQAEGVWGALKGAVLAPAEATNTGLGTSGLGNPGGSGGGKGGGHVTDGNVGTFATTLTTDVGGGIIQ